MFEVNPRAGELRKSGLRIKLQDQPLQVLIVLLEHPGEMVSREELQRRLWPADTFVDFDHSLNSAVKKLREALGDQAENPRFIETLHRRGYRFIAPVEGQLDAAEMRHGSQRDADSAPLTVSAKAVASTGIGLRWKLTVAAAMAVLALSVAAYFYFHRTPKLTEKDTIVLADFANSTGDAVFDDTLKTALSISLRQSPFLNVLPDSEVAKTLQEMTRPASAKLTPEVARELCQRAGSKAYVAGSIGSLGSEYVLGLKAVNCQSGNTLAEEQVTAASKEKVLNAVGETASKLRGELGESLATVQKFDVPLEQATTSSLDALKAYSLGHRAYNEKGSAASLPHRLRAIEIDPSFAMGYWAVGSDYSNLGEVGRASEYYTKAFQLREHASEWEKLEITADYYSFVTGELDKAVQTYQEEIQSYPRESQAYGNLGYVYGEQGQYEKATELARQRLTLAADWVVAYENLANYALALQRFDETRQVIHEAQARKLDDYLLHNALYALAFLGADSAAMAEQQKWYRRSARL